MEKERIFAKGLIWKRPDERTREKASWVKGHLSVKLEDFKKFLEQNGEGEWMNFDLKENKDKTKLYFELNTYGSKPKEVIPPVVQNEDLIDLEIDEDESNEAYKDF